MIESTPKFCSSCGAPVTTPGHICASCGAPLQSAQEGTHVQQAPGAQLPPVSSYGAPAYSSTYTNAAAQPSVKPKKGKGWLIALLIVLLLAAGLITLLALNGGKVSFSTTNLSEFAMASEVDPVLLSPTIKTDVFATDAPIVYATMLVKNAPEGTLVSAGWIYENEEYKIGTAEIATTETSQYVAFNLIMPDTGFPKGNYRVDISLDGEFQRSMTFQVK